MGNYKWAAIKIFFKKLACSPNAEQEWDFIKNVRLSYDRWEWVGMEILSLIPVSCSYNAEQEWGFFKNLNQLKKIHFDH